MTTTQASGKVWNSDDDEGDELLADYDTIATVPLYNQTQAKETQQPTQATFATQATQPLIFPIKERQSSPPIVEVARSSPSAESPRSVTPQPSQLRGLSSGGNTINGGRLASAMAPPGTSFRSPYVQQEQSRRGQQYPESSDDDAVKYAASSSSSDDELRPTSDITPTVFARGGKPIQVDGNGAPSMIEESPVRSSTSFRDFTEKYRFNNSSSDSLKRSADDLANSYGNSIRPAKVARQTGPAKARPVEEEKELTLDDIQDYSIRKKIEEILVIMPGHSIAKCQRALFKRGGHIHDALDLLAAEIDEEERRRLAGTAKPVVDSMSADGGNDKPKTSFKRPLTKDSRQDYKRVVESKKSIADKYSNANTSHILSRYSKPQQPEASRIAQIEDSPKSSTPIKPRKRLVQGRRQPSSPDPILEPPKAAKASRSIVIDSDSDDNDSGVEVQAEPQTGMEERLLQFLNTCSVPDLLDVSHQPQEHVETVLSRRPFSSLDKVREVHLGSNTKTKTGKISNRKNFIGDRLVDVCLEMWTGYEAVDQLVAKCEELGKPLADEMKLWGINVFGKSSEEEIQIVDLERSAHDSGIGTPVSSIASTEEDQDAPKGSSKRGRQQPNFLKQPAIMSTDITLKDYQVAGLNWLNLLFQNRMSCILADDMGLGKTCQVISFIAHLYETGIQGPHLVVVPGSTLENWLREFQHFCPMLRVEPYYGSQAERDDLRERLLDERDEINVIVTTYDMAISSKRDSSFLQKVSPMVCVYDEGHALKNSATKRYRELMRIPAKFRLLLTGTPLQNNLQELVSLLAFIMPDMFLDRSEDLEYIFKFRAKTTDSDHTALLSAQRISRARSMMKPFILRRKKHQVLKHLPKKTNKVEYCEMNNAQKAIYEEQVAKVKQALLDRASEGKSRTLASKAKTNALMDLRKAAIHPLLFRRLYTDEKLRKMSRACLKEPTFRESDAQLVFEDMQVMTDFELLRFCNTYPKTMSPFALAGEPWLESGKVSALVQLLKRHAANGDRTILFSQFTMVMDILEEVFQSASLTFSRLDGSTRMDQRQDLIDQFYQDETISVFMLSTKAGGTGINLVCANKVVIFDSSFNPQDDVQAENRAHRVGQTREVEVVRLVTKDTVEEQILALGESKLVLDERVAGASSSSSSSAAATGSKSEDSAAAAEKEGVDMVEKMLAERFVSSASSSNDKTRGGSGGSENVDSSISDAGGGRSDGNGKSSKHGPATAASSKRKGAGKKDLKDQFLTGLKAAGLQVSSS